MDTLTQILSSLRLTGGVVIDMKASGDFCLISQFTRESCLRFFPVPGTIIGYHVVQSGRLFAKVDGAPPIELHTGSVLVLPRNDRHLIYTREGLHAVDADDLLVPGDAGHPSTITIEGTGAPTAIFCGFLGMSAQRHPLFDSLPPMLALHHGGDARSDWVASSVRYLSEDRQSPEVVARLAELFVSEAIQRHMAEQDTESTGWAAGLSDPVVRRAIGLIHERFAEDLDLEQLAREAGVSRSVLQERFVRFLGEPPMRYAGRWRMQVAANMLRDGQEKTANVAYAVGFNSEAAFNRAFKREFGQPPGLWRRQDALVTVPAAHA
jgi:AraC-like DNA-binding protein